ncbi:MAG TPA: hypothetical protein VLA21_10985 [Candidatus Limnocylindria bacterium]|nr:hypothetical protein [Candidatus Limnocylindria bacterium]
MRKMTMLLAAVMLLAALTPALAVTPVYPALEGMVTEAWDGGFLLDTAEFGPVQVNEGEGTEWPGLTAVEVGAFVTVSYNGMMTRSIPPQVSALRVEYHRLDGFVVAGETPEGAFLMDAIGSGLVLVRVAEGMALPAVGDFVSVSFSGVMAMSYPGQAGALALEVLAKAEGEVSEVGEHVLWLKVGDDTMHFALLPSTHLPEMLAAGARVTLYLRAATDTAIAIFPAE